MRAIRPALLAVTLLTACGFGARGGDGCSTQAGCVTIHQGSYTFPVKRVVQGALEVRVTQSGMDFLTARIKDIVLAFFGADESGRAEIALSDLGLGDLSTELGPFDAGIRDVVVTLDLAGLQVELIPGSDPARLRVVATDVAVGLSGGEVAGGIDGLIFSGDAACGLSSGPDGYVALVSFDLVIELATALDGTLDVNVVSLAVDTKDVQFQVVTDCTIDECLDGEQPPSESECGECKTICGAADLAAGLADVFQDVFDDLIDSLVTALADDLANLLLDLVLNGQPLAVEGTLDVAGLASPLLPYLATASPLGVVGRPAGDAFAITGDAGTQGLDVTLDAGLDSSPVHPCVGEIGAEPTYTAGPRPVFPTAVPGTDEPYELALGVSEAIVNEAVWAAWKSGALCIDLTTEDLATLSSGQLELTAAPLDLLLPGLSEIAGRDAPVRIRIRPKLATGAQNLVTFGDGEATPHVGIALRDAVIAIEVMVGDHFLRAVSFQADLDLGVDVDPLPGARLGLRVASVDIGAVSLPENELVPEARLDLIVPFVVDLALGVLSDVPIALEIPTAGLTSDLLGVPLEPVVRHVGEAGPDGDWLQILVGLEDPAPAPLAAPQLDVSVPTPGELAVATAAGDFEYQVRVRGGAWSGWQQGDARVPLSRLWLLGEHVIEARLKTPRGLAGPATTVDTVVVVRPLDGALSGPEAPATAIRDDPEPPPTGCGAGGEGPWWLAAVLLALVAMRRRRALIVAAVVLLAAGGCAEDAAPGLQCDSHQQCPNGWLCGPDGMCVTETPCADDAGCCPGSVCFSGWCRPSTYCDAVERPCEGLGQTCEGGLCVPAPCDSDAGCPGSLRCAAGRCVDRVPCGGACPSGTACHVASGRCLDAADCPASCAPGELAVVSDASTVEPLACGADRVVCACSALPDVPPGRPGVDGRLVPTLGTPRLISYDPVYGDLVRSALDTTGARTDVVLDGVPSGAPVAPAGSYRGGVADAGPDRGRRPAVVLREVAGEQVIDVLYRDEERDGVRFARLRPDGTVLLETAIPIDGSAGRYSCLTVDPTTGQTTGLVFVTRDSTDAVSRLVRVRALAAEPGAEGDWEVRTVVERSLPRRADAPCDDACGLTELCAHDPTTSQDVCVSGLDGLSCPDGCPAHHVCAAGDAGGEPACLPRVYRRGDADRLPFGAGLFATCAAGPDGVVAAWYDADVGALMASEWPIANVDPVLVDGTSTAGDVPDVGRHARMAVDPDGVVGIAYQDGSFEALRFAERAGPGDPWSVTVVDDGATSEGSRDVGAWPSLVWIGARPVIAYGDATGGDVWLASRDGAGCWKSVGVLADGAWAYPDVVSAGGGEVWLSALEYGFDPDLTPLHQPVLRKLSLPTCQGR